MTNFVIFWELCKIDCPNIPVGVGALPSLGRAPGQAGMLGDIVFENFESLKAYRQRAITSMVSGYMPLANLTNLKETERAAMIAYLEAVRGPR